MAKARRTILRSSSGKKLYAKRNAKGQFKDIQSYKRAHGSDIRRKAKSEG
jgi:DNA-binding protein HU-beta